MSLSSSMNSQDIDMDIYSENSLSATVEQVPETHAASSATENEEDMHYSDDCSGSTDYTSTDESSDSSSDEEETEMMEMMLPMMVATRSFLESVCTYILNGCPPPPIERFYHATRRSVTTFGRYIHRVLDEDPEHFREEFRMYPDCFRKLCKVIRDKGILTDTNHIGVEEMIGLCPLVVGQNHRYPTLRRMFGRSHFAIHKNFHRGLYALNQLAVGMMVEPSQGVQPRIRNNTKFFPYFKDCIGSIDGTHISATVCGRETSSYRNRHGIMSQNVLAACNFDLEFIFVLAGWEGSAHDAKVLNAALTKANPFTVPQGKYYLVDCGFSNRRQFLAPFRSTRYHLQDFNGVGRHFENKKELFNLRHASLRNTVERIFGIFKSRFTIFKSAPSFPFKTQVELVLACAGLHNFLRRECRSDEFPPDDEMLPPPEIEDDVDVDQTIEQQRQEAVVWRDGIADAMWLDVTLHGQDPNYFA